LLASFLPCFLPSFIRSFIRSHSSRATYLFSVCIQQISKNKHDEVHVLPLPISWPNNKLTNQILQNKPIGLYVTADYLNPCLEAERGCVPNRAKRLIDQWHSA
jgi:hypothetical protein